MTFLLGMWLKALKGRAALGARNRRRITGTPPTLRAVAGTIGGSLGFFEADGHQRRR
jgi:hypothetical protein